MGNRENGGKSCQFKDTWLVESVGGMLGGEGRTCKDDFQVSGLSNWVVEVPFTMW